MKTLTSAGCRDEEAKGLINKMGWDGGWCWPLREFYNLKQLLLPLYMGLHFLPQHLPDIMVFKIPISVSGVVFVVLHSWTPIISKLTQPESFPLSFVLDWGVIWFGDNSGKQEIKQQILSLLFSWISVKKVFLGVFRCSLERKCHSVFIWKTFPRVTWTPVIVVLRQLMFSQTGLHNEYMLCLGVCVCFCLGWAKADW